MKTSKSASLRALLNLGLFLALIGLSLPASGQVPADRDIPYKGTLKLDVYRTPSANAPVLLYVHSGGWYEGDKIPQGQQFGEDLSARGTNVVAINYTLVPQGYYPTPLKDIDCALRWVAANAGAYGFDASRVYLGGYSAGAHLSLLYSLNANAYADSQCPAAGPAPLVKKIFSLAGPTDLTVQMPNVSLQGMVDNFLNGTAARQEASPVTYANTGNGRQYLLIQTQDDSVVDFATQAIPFYNKLMNWNPVTVQNKWYPTGDHCFACSRTEPNYPDVLNTLSTFLAAALPSINDAAFVSQSVPAAMTAGQSYNVSVTMRNTGTTTWTKTGLHRLGTQNPQDNNLWLGSSNRIELADTDSIAPNATKTFAFSVKAPSSAGTYNFQWKMLREGVEWFGALSTNASIVVQSAADTTPPAVSITAPANGATVSGVVNMTASASDNVGVAKVEFYVDGALKATATASPYSYSWSSTGVANGAHALLAKAYDAAGNTAQSSVSVNVANATPDTTPPTVSITAPANGATVSGVVNMTASASDNVGVAKVEFYVDGTLKATATASPYNYSWGSAGVANGAHALLAKAYDAAGNTAQSSVSVNVANATPDTTPPTVSITAPSNGATISGTVNLTASASDNVGVTKVEFYVDGDTTSPYAFALDTLRFANGPHTLLAKAYDAANNTAQTSIPVTIQNQNRADAVITSTGGILTTSQATIFLPPLAVSLPTVVTVVDEKTDDAAAITEREAAARTFNYTNLSSGIMLKPNGLRTNRPLNVTIPLKHTLGTTAASPMDTISVCVWDPLLKTWKTLPSIIDSARNSITAETDLFSVLKVFAPAPEAAPAPPVVGEVYVFPNPAKNGVKPVFHIETGPAKVEIQIHDFSGKLVYKVTLAGEPAAVNRNNKLVNAYEYAWDAANAASGAYFYIVTIDGGSGKTVRKGKFAIVK